MRWADAATDSAAALGFAARSALKLLSLSKSFPSLLPRGSTVLDLGCSPGAFIQVAAEAVGEKGLVFGIDLVEVDVEALQRQRAPFLLASSSPPPAPVFTRVADVFDLNPQTLSALFKEAVQQREEEERARFDIVLCDLCHSTLGVRSADAARSLDLARAAARLTLGGGESEAEGNEFGPSTSSSSSSGRRRGGVLARGGSFLVKVLEGAETPAFAAALRPCFDSVKWARPPATRRKSTEVYLVGLGRR